MKAILLLYIFAFCASTLSGQEAAAITWLGTSSIDVRDSIVVITYFGSPLSESVTQNETVATTDPLPYFLIREITTSTEGLPTIEGLKIFPNPTSGTIQIDFPDLETSATMTLISSDGLILTEKSFPTNNAPFEMDMSIYPKGAYILNIINQKRNARSTFRIIRL